jgi:hypothetical protein
VRIDIVDGSEGAERWEDPMKITVRRMLVLALLAVAAIVVPSASAAAAGLSVTGRYALLGDRAASVILVGQYTCGPYPGGVPDRGVIDFSVRQVVGGVEVTGIGYLEPRVCTGEPQWYAAELLATAGRFTRNTAQWSASGYVEGPGGVQSVFVPPTRIRIA